MTSCKLVWDESFAIKPLQMHFFSSLYQRKTNLLMVYWFIWSNHWRNLLVLLLWIANQLMPLHWHFNSIVGKMISDYFSNKPTCFCMILLNYILYVISTIRTFQYCSGMLHAWVISWPYESLDHGHACVCGCAIIHRYLVMSLLNILIYQCNSFFPAFVWTIVTFTVSNVSGWN